MSKRLLRLAALTCAVVWCAHSAPPFAARAASGDTYAVICPKGSVLGNHPAVFNNIRDRILAEIELEAGLLLAHHILMGLKHYSRNILFAGCRLAGNQHSAGSVSFAGERAGLCPIAEPVGNRALVTRLAGDTCYFLEDIKYVF